MEQLRGIIRDANEAAANQQTERVGTFYGRRLDVRMPERASLRSINTGVEVSPDLLATLGSLGGSSFAKVINDHKDGQELEGRIARQQNQTLQDLQASGDVDEDIERGWQDMDLVIRGQEWFNQKALDMEGEGQETDPDEYRAQLSEEFFGMRTGDARQDAMISAMAEDFMPKLAKAQLQSNAAWHKSRRSSKYAEMLYSIGTAAAPVEDINALVQSKVAEDMGVSPDEVHTIQASTAQQALKVGRPDLYLALRDAGFEGMLPGEETTLMLEYEKFEERESVQYNREMITDVEAVLDKSYNGEVSSTQALELLEGVQSKYDKDDRWIMSRASAVVNAVRAGKNKRRREATGEAAAAQRAAEEAKVTTELRFSVQDTLMSVRDGELSREAGASKILDLATKAGLENPGDFQAKQLNSVMSAHTQQITSAKRAAMQAAEEQAKEQAKVVELGQMLNDPAAFSSGTKKQKSAAMDLQMQLIDEHTQNIIEREGISPERAKDLSIHLKAEAMARNNYLHPGTQKAMAAAFSGKPVDARGDLKEGVLEALSFMQTLRQEFNKGSLADTLVSNKDHREYALLAEENLAAFPNAEDALISAYERTLGSSVSFEARQQTVLTELQSDGVQATLDDAVVSAIDRVTQNPSVLSGAWAMTEAALSTVGEVFGANSDTSPFDDWYYSDPGNRAKAYEDPDFKDAVNRVAKQRKLAHPAITWEQAANMAAGDIMARSTVMGGNVLTAPPGSTVLDRMGLSEFERQDGVAHAALREFLIDRGEEIWGDDWSERNKRLLGSYDNLFGVETGGLVNETSPAPSGRNMIDIYMDMGDVDIRLLDDKATTVVITPTMPQVEFFQNPETYVAQGVTSFLAWVAGDQAPQDIIMPSEVVTLAEIGSWYKAKRELNRQ